MPDGKRASGLTRISKGKKGDKQYIFFSLKLVFLIGLFSFLALFVNSYRRSIQNLYQTKSTNLAQLPISTVAPTGNITEDRASLSSRITSFASPSGYFVLTLIKEPEDRDTCSFVISNQVGWKFPVDNLIQPEMISCRHGMGGIYSNDVLGWTSLDELLLDTRDGAVEIINFISKSKKTYSYDFVSYTTIPTNSPANMILLRNKAPLKGTTEYVLTNTATGGELAHISLISDGDHIFYDHINSGYLFIRRSFENDTVETMFTYFDVDTLRQSDVLANDPVYVQGRGCGPMILYSRENELIVDTGGCLALDENKYSEDGFVHIDI